MKKWEDIKRSKLHPARAESVRRRVEAETSAMGISLELEIDGRYRAEVRGSEAYSADPIDAVAKAMLLAIASGAGPVPLSEIAEALDPWLPPVLAEDDPRIVPEYEPLSAIAEEELRAGIDSARRGEITSAGDFTQYLDDDAETHVKVMNWLERASVEEVMQASVKAGIYNKDGSLSRHYRR